MARKPPVEKYTGLLARPLNVKRWPRERDGDSDRDVFRRLINRPPWNEKKRRKLRDFEKTEARSQESAVNTLEKRLNEAKRKIQFPGYKSRPVK